jgi:cytochrome d ubiquinol oxidase subunit II
MSSPHWLPIAWAGIAAFTVLAYIVLDGFDLGVGMLFLVEKDPRHRDIMVNTVAPVWDGNETWLVLGGACLYGVFPLAYSTLLPALYPPIIAMLLALIFRGVAFEFRFKAHSPPARSFWDLAFMCGSTVAAATQGVILGALIQGIKVQDDHYAGVWRTEGELQTRARGVARPLAAVTIVCIVVVSLWTPALQREYLRHWDVWPSMLYVAPVPVLVGALVLIFWRTIADDTRHLTPFLCVLGWFFLCFTGLGISIWPWIVPPSIDIWQASSPPASQSFLLVGAVVLIPTVLAYTAYAYWVFRGKVGHELHDH